VVRVAVVPAGPDAVSHEVHILRILRQQPKPERVIRRDAKRVHTIVSFEECLVSECILGLTAALRERCEPETPYSPDTGGIQPLEELPSVEGRHARREFIGRDPIHDCHFFSGFGERERAFEAG